MNTSINKKYMSLPGLMLIFTFILLSGFTSTLAQTQSVNLQWQPSLSNGVIGYNMYRSQVQGSGYQKINTQVIAATSFTDESVEPGITYYYVCRAITADGIESDNSNEASFAVEDTNTPPEAIADSIQTDEDTWIDITPLDNDYDDDGDTLEISALTQPQNGTATLNNPTEIRYTPEPDFNGQDSFTYTITDPGGKQDTAQITVSIIAVNDPVQAFNDVFQTNEDTAYEINLLANDSYPDNEEPTVELVDLPTSGSAVMLSGGICRYTPSADYFGPDSFSYRITGSGDSSDTATVSVTVYWVLDGPDAFNDSFTTAEDTAMLLTVLANDLNPDGSELTVAIMTPPVNGSAEIQADGTVLYTPAPNFSGSDYFTYSVADNVGLNDSAAVTVTVTPGTDVFSASGDSLQLGEDGLGILNILGNDNNPDNLSLTVEIQSAPLHGQAEITQDGELTYTPAEDFHGTDTLTYSLTDSEGNSSVASVSITVNPENDPPLTAGETASTREDEPVTLQLLANDTDIDNDPLTASLRTAPTHGMVVISISGEAVYTPDKDFFGTDSFSYEVSDGSAVSSAEVQLSITPVNDPPEAVNDSAETDIDKAISLNVLDNDSDPDGDALIASLDSSPSNGTVTLHPDGSAVYTPSSGYEGTDTFTYRIADASGEFATAQVNIAVIEINNAPIASMDSASVAKKSVVTFNILDNDSDPDGDPIELLDVSIPDNGTVRITNPSAGEIEYTPDTWFRGTDRFTYTISDGKLEATGIISVTVLSRNSILKFRFPRSISDGTERLAETYVGVGIINPNKSEEDVSFLGFDETGTTRDVIQLGEKLPPQGQVALMTSELGRTDENVDQMTVEGESGDIQGFFMVGDTGTNRLDGVGGIQFPSRAFYFPLARENNEETSLFYLVSENPEQTAMVTATLYRGDGQVVATKDLQIPPNGSASGSVKSLFGEDLTIDNGYIKIYSTAYISGYEIIATDKSVSAYSARSPQISEHLFAPHFIAGDGNNSFIRILNNRSVDINAVVTLMDDKGQTMVSKSFIIIGSRATDLDLGSLLAEKYLLEEGLLTGSVLIEMEGGGDTAGTITMLTAESEAVTSMPLANDGMMDFVFPQVAQSSNRSIFMGFSIMNPGDQVANAVLSIYDGSGQLTAEKQLAIPALHRITDLLSGDLFFGSGFSQMGGHIKITSDQPLVSVSIYGDYEGRYLSTVEGQPGETETAAANAEMERILAEANDQSVE